MKEYKPDPSGLWWPYWWIHHCQIVEIAIRPVRMRKKYIREFKPRRERATRLRYFQPVKRPDLLPRDMFQIWRKFVKSAHGKGTIFAALPWDVQYLSNRFMIKANLPRNRKRLLYRLKREYPGCPVRLGFNTLLLKFPYEK